MERAARMLRAQDRQWALLRARLVAADANGAGSTMAAPHPLDEACGGSAMCAGQPVGTRPSVVTELN